MKLSIDLGKDSYDILIEKGGIEKAGEEFNLNRKVLIVTDSGVPAIYAKKVKSQTKEGIIFTFPQGEENKNFDTYKEILSCLSKNAFTRTDAIIAVGGGVVGDMSGFAAATYMRGIDFYNIPTTTLSQIDSSIGGKTAIDFSGYKNIVGAFYQPKGVIIDTDLTKTLDERQIASGLAEAVKMASTHSEELFSIFENASYKEDLEKIVQKSLEIKKQVVESDVFEGGIRKVLNFGHTLGHAIESEYGIGKLYHGECVALGMVKFSFGEARERIVKVLKKLNLPTEFDYNKDKILKVICHDKKADGSKVTVVKVLKIGEFTMEKLDIESLKGELI